MSQRKRTPASDVPCPVAVSALPPTWRAHLLVVIGLTALVAGVFGRAATFELLSWDDNYHIAQNPGLNPPSVSGVIDFWRQPYLGLYAPLSYTFFAVEAVVGRLVSGGSAGAQAVVFHLGNLTLHTVCTALAYLLLFAMARHVAAAALAAALFAVHPLQVESVAWVSETRGLLSAVFCVAALLILVRGLCPRVVTARGAATDDLCADGSRGSTREGWAVVGIVLCTGLALLSKPSAAALPVALAVVGLHQGCRRKPLAIVVLSTLALAGSLLWMTKLQQADHLMHEVAPLWQRPLIALNSLAFYLGKLIWPIELGADYGWRPSAIAGEWWFYVAWIVPAVLAGAIYRFDRTKHVLAASGIFAAFLLPVLGLVPFGFQEISTVADRYAYLPLLGLGWLVALLLARRWNFGWGFAAVCLVAVCAAASSVQLTHWRDDGALFARMLQVNPASFVARMNLSIEAIRRGRIEAGIELGREATELAPNYAHAWYNRGSIELQLAKYPEAVAALARANALAPHDLRTLNNLGRALIESKQLEPAVNVLKQAVQTAAKSREAHTNLADAYLRSGDETLAEQHLRAATEIDPAFADAWLIYARLRRTQGRLTEACTMLAEAIDRQPGYATGAFALGELYLLKEQWALAQLHFARAARLRPNWPQAEYQVAWCQLQQGQVNEAVQRFERLIENYPQYVDPFHGLAQVMLRSGETERAIALYEHALSVQPNWLMGEQSLGWIYATAASRSVRNGNEAVQRVQRVLDQVEQPGPELLDVAAAAHAANGAFEQAVEFAERAAETAARLGRTELANRIAVRLDQYRSGEFYTDDRATTRIAHGGN